jgi:hypothetical protein
MWLLLLASGLVEVEAGAEAKAGAGAEAERGDEATKGAEIRDREATCNETRDLDTDNAGCILILQRGKGLWVWVANPAPPAHSVVVFRPSRSFPFTPAVSVHGGVLSEPVVVHTTPVLF